MGTRRRVGPLREAEVTAIRVRMAELGYRRDADLARAAGVGVSDLSHLLNRRREPSLHVALRLARALGWSVERLIGVPPVDPVAADAPGASRTRYLGDISAALAYLAAVLAPEPDPEPRAGTAPVVLSDRLNSGPGGRGRRTSPPDDERANVNKRRPHLVGPNGRGAADSGEPTARAA